MTFHCAGELNDLWHGELRAVNMAGRKVLLLKDGERVCAYEDRCQHLGVALSEGVLDGHVLTCRAHGWSYDARTGAGLNPEATQLVTLPVEIRDGQIFVDPRLDPDEVP